MKSKSPISIAELWVLLLAILFHSADSQAVLPPERLELPNFDRRMDRNTNEAVTPNVRAAEKRLQARLPKAQVTFDPVSRAPKFISAGGEFLTDAGGQGKAVSAAAAARFAATDAYRPTKAFLQEHRELFGHGPEALDKAQIKREFTTPHNGLKTVVWEQQVDGVPLFESVLISHTTARAELVNISSQFLPDPAAAADLGTTNRAKVMVTPNVSARKAVAMAAKNITEEVDEQDVAVEPENNGKAADAEKRQFFTSAKLAGKTEAKLVWLPMSQNQLRLCWDVTLTSRSRGEMFRVLVDVQTGEPLVRRCLTDYLSDATYRVYTSDSPSPLSPSYSTPVSTQPPLTNRVLVTLSALNTNASPNGWINDGGNETLGNNVDAHTDQNANDVADLPRPQGSPARVFDFPLDLAQAPSTYANASVVQLFYWNNFMHDRLYELGFTEAAGNFQSNNFGRGGLGNDAVQADAQDGSGVNNANFSTPSDGSAGRMQMYIFNGPTPDRDGDLDAEVVLHEYTHGLSNRRVGGGVGLSALQSRGMGEGWSDFYAMTLLSEPGDDVNGVYASGGYVTYLLSGLTQNYYFGIRRYPYCTDTNKNPLTFKDIDPTKASAHSGIPRSPISSTTANEVHNMGEVWCMVLREVWANLVTKHGWAVGNQLTLQLVTDGMNLSPANPNFLQARDAILQADMVDTGGANQFELWSAFAKRGMGSSATSPASSTSTGVVEAYDSPLRPLRILVPVSAAEGAGVLSGAGEVQLLSPATSNVVVTLTSSKVSEATVPTTVTVLTGQSNAVFDLTIIDDAVLDGTQISTISGAAAGFASGTTNIAVFDNETAVLQVALPAIASEGQGPVTGAVQVSAVPAADIIVGLSSSDTTEIQLPATATILAGQTSAVFTATVVDDGVIDGSQTATITAHVQNWTDGSTNITVLDNENLNLAVSLPASAWEQSGVVSNAGAVSISGTLTTNLLVSLESAMTDKLIVPSTVTILAGQISNTFNLTLVDNPIGDGQQTVAVTASAPGFTNGLATLLIMDDESPIIPSNPRPVHFAAHVPANTNLMWSNSTNTISTNQLVLNGGFESGSFSNWIKTNSTTAGDWLINNGTYDPPGTEGLTPPYAGGFSVVAEQTGPGTHTIYQDLVIPSVISSATLSWVDRIRNYATLFDPNTQVFRVEIRGTNNGVLALAFTTKPGDPLLNDWTARSFDLSPYAGQKIRIAFVETDSLNYFNVHLDEVNVRAVSPTNTGPSVTVTNDVYFGTNPTPGPAELQGSTTNSAWTLPLLAPQTTYYWQIVARRGGTATSPVWQFTTAGVDHFVWSTNPSPQYVNQPFSAAIAAKDAFNTTVTNFSGPVNLSATNGSSLVIAISPTNSGSFVNGVWSGNITVQQPASNVTLRAADGGNYSGTSNPFDVLLTNDISINVTAAPNPVSAGVNLTYTLTVTNTGPLDATGVMVTNLLPPNIAFVSATSSQGSCAQSSNLVTCDLGLVPGGSNAAITVVVMPTVAGFTLTNRATLSRTEADNYLGNNTAIVTTPVTTPAISIADGSMVEGNIGTTNMAFAVTLAVPSAQTITVNYATGNDGSAVAGSDYVATNGVLTFPPGVTNGTISVAVIGDIAVETNETFLVNLSSPVNGTLGRAQAVGTIINNDGFPGDADHFTWSAIASPQLVGQFFKVTLTALDASNSVATNFNGVALLSSTNASVNQSLPNDFTNGIWSGTVAVQQRATNLVLRADDGNGHFGLSNPFDVAPTNMLPVILSQPTNRTILAGGSATFTVVADGTPPLAYLWSLNGTNFTSMTNASVTLTNVQLDQAGNYAVTVTNNFGSVLSSNALLTVNLPPPVPVITGMSPASAVVGASVILSGINFSSVPASNIVYFGAVRANVTSASLTSLTVVVPGGATYAPPSVTVAGLTGQANSSFVPTFDNGAMIDPAAFAPKFDLTAGGIQQMVLIGDMDGDGRADLVTPNAEGNSVSVLRNISTNGSLTVGSFAPKVDFPLPGSSLGGALADVDGDGKLDIIAANGASGTGTTVGVLRNTSTPGAINSGSFAPRVDFTTATGPTHVTVGDVDGDGRLDLAVATYQGAAVSVLRNTSTPGSIDANSFAPKIDLAFSASTFDVKLADLDGDGRKDLVVVGYDSGVMTIIRNLSSPGSLSTNSFAGSVNFAVGSAYDLAVGDLDGDNKPDVAIAKHTAASVAVLRNTSTVGTLSSNSFAAPVSFATGSSPHGVAIGDLNGDGKPDLATANESSASISVLRNTTAPGSINSSSFAPKVDFATSPNPTGIAIGDLDGDGRPDLATSLWASSAVSVLRNNVAAIPPTITQHPADVTVSVGLTASFNSAATGSLPLAYQWRWNGTNIAGATNAAYTIVAAQENQAGLYSVRVTNLFGAAVSSNALLTVLPLSGCLPAPAGLVSWWPGESTATDIAGTNAGVLENGTGFTTGKVGSAFNLDGADDRLRVPASSSLNVGPGPGFTLEAWINPFNVSFGRPIFEWNNASASAPGLLMWVGHPGSSAGYLSADLYDGNADHIIETAAGTIVSNAMQHVALTYERTNGVARLFINGVMIKEQPMGQVAMRTTEDLYIGARLGSVQPKFFQGIIDEPGVYSRALTTNEIAAIYAAGGAGKCSTPMLPIIITQPSGRTNVVGTLATFSVVATGATPLSYQWLFNGTNLNNATNATLTLTNVQFNQAGNYAVTVTNLYGVTTSSNAVLGVVVPACVPPATGIVAWWRGEGDASDGVNGSAGTLIGGVGFNTGEVGQGFAFNGASSYVSIPDSALLDAFTNRLTLELWFRANSTNANGSWAALVAKGNTAWRLQATTGAKTLTFSTTGTSGGDMTGTRNVNDGQWHHAAGVYDGTNMFLYVDGTLDVSKPATGLIAQNDYPVTIGANDNPPSGVIHLFNGSVDEVSLYNRGLSAGEIAAIYTAGSLGKCYIPAAPTITTQPVSRTNFAGTLATFNVTATGTWPLSYQWSFNGTNLNNATNATLTLANVQFNQAGSYAVTVTNLVGATNSANAVLTVIAPVCAPPTSGIAAWWRGEGNTSDDVGASAGTLIGGAGFNTGEVGQGFAFNGTSSYVSIPDSQLLDSFTNRLTVEFWFRANSTNANGNWATIVAKGGTSWRMQATEGAKTLTFSATGTSGGDLYGTRNVNDGQWHHVAGTYDGTNMFLYIDGTLDVSKPSTGLIAQNDYPMAIGANDNSPSGVSYFFNGLVDEMALYNRGLSANEIAAIYNAGSLGKCYTPTSPIIITQPTNRVVFAGMPATFNVTATGTWPLSYQWSFNGTNLNNATNATLTLTNVQLGQAGNYAVTMTNLYGSTVSSNAILSVTIPVCAPSVSGIRAWWRGEGDVSDTVGNSMGTLIGGAGFSTGKVGQGFAFNGASSYVSIPDSALLDAFTNRLTIELWFQANSTNANPVWAAIVAKGNTAWRLQATEGAKTLTFSTTGTSGGDMTGTRNVNDGQWHHVAGVYDGTNMFLYVDGTLDVSKPATGLIAQNDYPMAIGANDNSPSGTIHLFNGSVDEVALYHRALSVSEIAAIYNAGSLGKCYTPAPTITTQPTSRTNVEGTLASFNVTAYGAGQLSYQWLFNGTNLSNATNATLTLPSAQLSQAGNYVVTVTNHYGSATSSNAMLTVLASACVPPASGIVGWWRGEGDASDGVGNNTGEAVGGAGFDVGKVSQGFSFNGSGGYVSIPDSPTLDSFSNRLTVEFWFRPNSTNANGTWSAIVAKGGTSWRVQGTSGAKTLTFSTTGTSGGDMTGTRNVNDGLWHHAAGVYDGTNMFLYVDGTLDVSKPATGLIAQNDYPMAIGANANLSAGTSYFFNGSVDEVTLYNRGLSASEIATICNAGIFGKCYTPTAPMVLSHPTNRVVFAGMQATFSALATGTWPLSYQWSFNGTNISNATNTTLTLTNVQLSQTGNYAVTVTNLYGTATSSNAMLTVNPPVCAPPASGIVGWWRGEGDTSDVMGASAGTLVGGAVFSAGEVGQSFSFNGTSSYVSITNLGLLNTFTNRLTVECWVRGNSTNANGSWGGIVAKGNTSWRMQATAGAKTVTFSMTGTTGGDMSGSRNVNDGQWHHVAGVYDGTNMFLYIDGTLDVSKPSTGLIAQNNIPVAIGANVNPSPGTSYFFNGSVDEVALYNRGLSATEIAAIYNAGYLGKCFAFTSPTIITQPANQETYVGGSASFSVAVNGINPLIYQWQYNGTNISGATNSTLNLSNVNWLQAGSYAVRITNLFGSTISSNASLAVYAHHFEWSAIPSPITAKVPFAATLLAKDVANNIISNFTGTLSLSATTTNIVGANLDFEAGALAPWTPLNLGNQPGPYGLATFDVNGDGNSSTAFRIIANSGAPDGIAQNVLLIGGATYSVKLDIATDDSNDSNNGDGGTTTILIGGTTVAQFGWGFVSIGNIYRTNLTGSFTPPTNGVYPVTLTFSRGFFESGNLACLADDLRITSSGSAIGVSPTNIFSFNNGAWNGSLTLLNPGTNVALIANDGHGHVGLSSLVIVTNPTPPIILVQPVGQTVLGGSNVTFSVGATGTAPLYYSWQKNAAALGGPSSTSLTLSNVTRTNSGTYSVVITNVAGSVTSSNAVLLVRVPQQLGTPVLMPDGTFVLVSSDAGGGVPSAADLTRFEVQASTNLVDWISLPGALTPTNGVLQFHDVGVTNAPMRFYRIVEN